MSNLKTANLFATLAFGLVMATTACTARERVAVYVPSPPPPAVRETIVVSPGPGYVWIGGYHAWNGSAYVWTPGRWELRPARRHAWVPGHWKHDRRGWYWVEGHWR
jgi:hypothetical protein